MTFGSSEFISILPPPGPTISTYNRTLPPTSQPATIPQLFLDAMSVRENVFVQEQKVPLTRELDADDARAYHWLAYASVSRRSSSGAGLDSSSEPQGRRESETSTAVRVPAGTIRLIPPLDPGNPPTDSAQTAPHPSVLEPNESYILLGRLAVCSQYRKLGLGRLLVNAALEWARTNGVTAFQPSLTPAEVEAAKLNRHDDEGVVWKGVVCVHSQKSAQAVWARFGFVLDENMAEWDEEGIEHVGMWQRLNVLKSPVKK